MIRRLPLLFFCFVAAAHGQAPPGLPGAPAAANGNGGVGLAPVNPNTVIREDVTLPSLSGDELAELYTRYTGRRVTVSVAAADAEFRFIQPAPLTYADAAQLIKRAALLEGFVFVPDVNMENHEILVVATAGANPKGEGLEVVIDPADLPQEDRVVSYVMNLKYIKPEEIVNTFTTVVGQLGPYGSITPVPNAGSVVITEKTSLIRRLVELKEQIDVSASVATRFIKVQYADVQELSEVLNEIFNTQQESERSAGVQRVQGNQGAPAAPQAPPGVPTPANTGAAGGADSGSAAEEVPIQIVPDTRTNRLFVMGRPVDILFVEGLVAEFDTPSDQRNFLRRKLRFVAVADFLEIAEPALLRAFSGDATGASGGAGRSTGANFGGNTSGRNNRSNTTSTGISRSTSGAGTSTSFGRGGTSGGLGGGGLGGSSLGDPQINSAPEARLVGRTLLVADNITNSLVVQGTPASLEIVNNLIDQIDVKAEQVMISAVFGQLALGEDFNFGVDYVRTLTGDGVGDGEDFAGRGGSGQFPLVPLDGTAFNPGSLATGSGLSLYGNIGNNFNVIVNALQSDSRFEVLSRPTIFTGNNQKGTIAAGERIAVPTNSFQGGVSNGISTNIEYQDVLLSLEVIPLVNSEEEVTLEIALLNDEVIGEQIIEGVGAVPTIGRREVLTTVTVPNASTIVLGGLINSRIRESVSGIPLLSDIPGLGKLFSSTQNEDERSELMIFIQPRIVSSPASLYDAQVDMDGRYDVAPAARDFAEGPAVLPQRGEVPVTKGGARGTVESADDGADDRGPRLGRPGSLFR